VTVEIPTLRDARPSELFAAADAYAKLAAAFGQHSGTWKDGVDNRVRSSGWTGRNAETAEASLAATTGKLTAAQLELDRIAPILREGAEAFLIAQAKLKDALADADAGGFEVAENGGVSWPPPSQAERHDPDFRDRSGEGTQIRDRIAAALQEAEHADQVTAERLRHYTDNGRTGDGLKLDTAMMDLNSAVMSAMSPFGGPEDLVASGMPGKDAPATEVNSWWKALPADEQQRLIQRYPDEIGNRDGIPTPARDQANRLHLDQMITDLKGRQNLSDQDRKKLEGFEKIKGRLAQEEQRHDDPKPFLLAIDDEGQGRGAIAFGNPDTADDVVAYVPGLNTEIGDIGGKDGNRAKDLWSASHNADPSKKISSIAWLGYDAPQAKEFSPESLAVSGPERGQQGGAGYQGFLQGLRASHEGQPAHVTALGHSYGSFTVGQAAQRPGGIPADDIILVGSPGTGAQHASQLGASPSHVWVGAADNDPVTHLPSHREAKGIGAGAVIGGVIAGPLGAVAGGFIGDQVGRSGDPHELWFGQDPASRDFGANRFDVAEGPLGFSSHSDYWNDRQGDGGSSLRNMAQIVTGHGDEVGRQEYR